MTESGKRAAATGPPYRADHVGSLLRPHDLQEARQQYLKGSVGPSGFCTCDELRTVEDGAIRRAVAMQQAIGLPAVTDGEYRRSFWHYDFMGALTGIELVERGEGIPFHGKTLRPIHPTIAGRVDFPDDHPMLAHFRFLAIHSRRPAQDVHSGAQRLPLPCRP